MNSQHAALAYWSPTAASSVAGGTGPVASGVRRPSSPPTFFGGSGRAAAPFGATRPRQMARRSAADDSACPGSPAPAKVRWRGLRLPAGRQGRPSANELWRTAAQLLAPSGGSSDTGGRGEKHVRLPRVQSAFQYLARAALRAPGGQPLGATTMAYQWYTVRRGGATPRMAACRRNPAGGADWRRRAALLVVGVSGMADTPSSSRLARLAIAPRAAAGGTGRRSQPAQSLAGAPGHPLPRAWRGDG